MNRFVSIYKLLASITIGVLLFFSSTYPVNAQEPTYTITVPGTISLGAFASTQNYESTELNISATVSGGTETTVDIAVKDAKANNPGYLTLSGGDNSGATKLTNELQVKGGSVVGYTDLLSTDTLLADNAALSSGSYSISNFAVSQAIAAGDLALTAGDYSLTMTFIATFN